MEENNIMNYNNINIENTLDKKYVRQLLYNNLIKSSKKPKSNLSILPTKLNIKQKNEMTLNNTKKGIKEKIPISSKNLLMIKNINKINKKAKLDIINNNNKANITYQNNINSQQSNNITKEKKLIPSKISKIRTHTKSLSMSNIPIINDNSNADMESSHEKSPSELRTPKTISEDSFILDKKEKNSNENIKVNIKSDDVFKLLNLDKNKIKKTPKKKMILDSHNINSSKNINKKLRLNNQNNFFGLIPKIQKSIIVQKKKILNSNNKNTANKNRSKYDEKIEPIHQLKKNFSYHSIKFYLNQKLENKKGIKKNKNIGKIPINNNFKKKFHNNNKDNNKDINKTENIYQNELTKKEKTIFKLNRKMINNFDINNTSLNNKTKKDDKNKNINSNIKKTPQIYYLKKNPNNNSKLTLNLDNSNNSFKNSKELLNDNSGKNIIYAPKKIKSRLRSHEKKLVNIYNKMSYDPDRVNDNFSKSNNIKNTDKKEEYPEMTLLQEKNNSFCLGAEKLKQIFIKNENSLNTPRINCRNNILRLNSNNENNNHRIRNDIINYFNRTSEQVKNEGNNTFMPSRLTINGKVENDDNNIQNQNFNNSINVGINLNTDFNDYNISNLNNIFNDRAFINKMNIFPQGYNLSILSPFNHSINQTNLINLYNNNYLNFNTIQGRPHSFINNTNYNLYNNATYQYSNEINKIKNYPSINIEDIIILQEKLKYIIIALNKIHTMANECFEFLNFYYNSSIYCQLEKSFTNPLEANNVRISINCTLISIIICYDYSFEMDLMNKAYATLLNIIKLNYKNLIIIYEHILSKISIESKNNIWVKKLSNIINSYKKIEPLRINNLSKIGTLNYNTNVIFQNLIIILRNFKTYRNEYFLHFFNNIMNKSYAQINIFFREYILRTNNLNGSILASVYLKAGKNINFIPVPSPYVRTKNNKNFSLVLDLDETLVHFKEQLNNEGNGVLRIRPGIPEFFDQVGKYYELIVFTTATQDYADTLIDAIEENKIYFDHRLYRNHAIIINNDFVKDLTRIGRPLDKIIIVDNMPQNFRLQKENGIMIKPFWGEDKYDTALIDLIPILINIAKDGGDVRKGLIKYKEDILKKVSSTISKEIL